MVIYFNRYLELSFTQIMLLQSIFMFSSAIFEIPTGILGDKFGRKLSVIASNVTYTLGFSFYLFKLPFVFYALGEILMGIGRAFGSGSEEALQYDTFKELKIEKYYQKFVSLQRSVILISFILSGLFATFVLDKGLSMRFLWITTPISFLFSTLVLIFFIKEPKVKLEKELVPNYKEYLKSALETLRESKVLKTMVIISFSFGTLRYLLNWSIQPLFAYFKIPVKYYTAIILTSVSLVSLAVHQVLLKKKENLKYLALVKILLAVNLFFILILLLLKFFANIQLLLILGFILYRSLTQELMQIARSFWQPFIESFNRATVLSGISFLNTLIFALVNIFWGALLDLNLYWSVVLTSIVLTSFTALFAYKFRRSWK